MIHVARFHSKRMELYEHVLLENDTCQLCGNMCVDSSIILMGPNRYSKKDIRLCVKCFQTHTASTSSAAMSTEWPAGTEWKRHYALGG